MKYLKIISGILVVMILLFQKAGNFLVVEEIPKKSYAIVVLTGGGVDRAGLGIELFKKGYSENLLFSGRTPVQNNITASEEMKAQAMKLGVPEEKIILENTSTSTYENALFTKQLLQKDKAQSAIIVTSNYHMRRSRLVFDKAFKGTGIKLTYCASQDKNFRMDGWFLDAYSRDIVFSEYIKIVGYWIERKL